MTSSFAESTLTSQHYVNAMERDFSQLMASIQAKINTTLKGADRDALLAFAAAVFAHNPTGDWLRQQPDELMTSLQRLYGFAHHFDKSHKTLVTAIEEIPLKAASQTKSNVNGFSQVMQKASEDSEMPLDEALPRTEVMVVSQDMPFIVDSIRILMNKEHLHVLRQLSSVVIAKRKNGQLIEVRPTAKLHEGELPAGCSLESVMYLQLRESLDEIQGAALEEKLSRLLKEVRAAQEDYPAMLKHCNRLAKVYEDLGNSPQQDPEAAQREGMPATEASAFLKWLGDDHFVFLGARRYVYQGGMAVPDQATADLGWLKADSSVDLQEEVPLSLYAEQPIYFAKSATVGRIHRPAYPDILRVVEVDESGKRIGEFRFVGLYTSAVYRTSVRNIPIVRTLANNIANESQFLMNGYDGKFLWQLMETYPRDEWLQSSFDHLNDVFMQVIAIQERPLLRVLTRVDAAYRFVSVIVFVPKERYNTALRQDFEAILQQHLPVIGVNFDVYFSESVLARVHMTVRVNASQRFQVNSQFLQEEFVKASLTWEERLVEQLRLFVPRQTQTFLETEFVNYFPDAYKAETSAADAARDIYGLNQIQLHRQVHLELQRHEEDSPDVLRLKLYGRGDLPAYSKMIPILEYMGFHVESARSYRLTVASGTAYSITHYTVKPDVAVAIVDTLVLQPQLEDAIDRVLSGQGSSDHFNRLFLMCGLNVAQVRLLRAYARYMRQIGFNLSYRYMALTLGRYPAITKQIVNLFELKFNVGSASIEQRQQAMQTQSVAIENALEDVAGVDDDRILRQYLHLVLATKRTNYYKVPSEATVNPFLALKLKPAEIPGVPRPVPYFEIFVYSNEMEGVHLRGGPVARGGLRWSDRLEDYRTEVLGLVKAQQVKNAVIVPVGAKGCFVCKRLPARASRQDTMHAVQNCYKTFIRGLLSVTDNLEKGQVIPPENVIRFDGDDPYLVVAADKGTATFSDLANQVAREHQFWLGDAFASGGSQGYDHKKMGITARGGWVSVQQHFREMNINTQTDPFTVIGIGDMAGDVFGNGMLLSQKIRLVAAFNHRHIFIDPNPHEATSYEERQRLFNLPQSSWEDYKTQLISAGGGVFGRDLKFIKITPQMAQRFQIKEEKLTPTALIHQLLQAPVDLIWNGGIGTYVKSSQEENLKVGDKANDVLRVDGRQLRCKVLGEGGNLGATQLGRIEAAQHGVRLNTDFIDNAGGVDCSDHEVNIKILLADLMQQGKLDESARNILLEQMTGQVAALVLKNNANQVRVLGLAQHESHRRLGEYRRLISRLEQGPLDRALEFLPDDEELHERGLDGKGLTRPELAVLMCYTKAELKETLAHSPLAKSQYALNEAYTAFPLTLVTQFASAIHDHRLIQQIAATQMSNSIVHRVGITVVQRMRDTSGADIHQTLSAYLVVKNILNLDVLWADIEALTDVAHDVQLQLFFAVQRLLRRSMRLLLRQSHSVLDVAQVIHRYQVGVDFFFSHVGSLLQDEELQSWQDSTQTYTDAGVPEKLAQTIAACDFGLAAFDIVDAHLAVTNDALQATSHLYFRIRSSLGCQWLESQIRELPVMSQWTAMAREALLDDLYSQQGELVARIIDAGNRELSIHLDNTDASMERVSALIIAFRQRLAPWIERWTKTLGEMQSMASIDHPVATVGLRELAELVSAARDWARG